MLVTVVESGELEAARSRVIRNDVSQPVIIEYVIPEGTLVEKGQEIIRFKCKELEDELSRQVLTVSQADIDYQTAVSGRELKDELTANSVRKAEQSLVDAKAALERYKEGEYPTKKGDATSAVQLAKRDLTLAEEKLNFKLKANSDPLLDSPFSLNEIEAERLSVDRLKTSVTKAQAELDMLEKYDYPRQARDLEMDVVDEELALKRETRNRELGMESARREEQSKEFAFHSQTDKLKAMRDDWSKLVVKADTPGLVVYETGQNRWRNDNITVAVSEKIQPRQQLMIIPDMSTLQVKTRVYESIIEQLRGSGGRHTSVAHGNAAGAGKPAREAMEPGDGQAEAPEAGGEGDAPPARKGRKAKDGGGATSGPAQTMPSTRSAATAASQEDQAGGSATRSGGDSAPASTQPATSGGSAAREDVFDETGTEATIRLDSKADLVLNGHIHWVAPLPDSQDRWGPSVKVFNAIVRFDRNQVIEGLKPGMTAQVELTLARLDNVLQVPVAAVFTEAQETFVYRVVKGRAERVAIKVGHMNDKSVEVTAGLNEGDEVCLTPPADATAAGTAGDKKEQK